ncbi:hypothetical protein RSOLAG1IB_10793 [Rhizoctonia solani AG-1 IB]|uniref:Uncharacterized protein n=2 Tax=Thanatephorus cucumeris (strain AG1-IB / isolate 7/3/14) TaxID=1108050 RepID=A0A0B7G4T3_THACB|nr:hypothetical protein RSOLAG1IB_10793 [Rhizoctonia solani AG-1 IB]
MEVRRNSTTSTEWRPNVDAWIARLSLTMILNVYKKFNGDGSIPEDAQKLVDEYYTDSAVAISQDYHIDDPRQSKYFQILTGLLSGSLEGARYILVFAAVILLSLGFQSLIHSRPKDRYQWGVIACRLLMGLVISLLLLLNLGKYQEFFVLPSEYRQRAGVFQWLEAFWVLPTIAIAYGVQFLIEITLAGFAKWATIKALREKTDPESPGSLPVLEHSDYPGPHLDDSSAEKAKREA